VDEKQPATVHDPGGHEFKPRKLTWKAAAALFFITVVLSYIIAWKIVKGPVNLIYRADALLIKGRIDESLAHYEKALEGNRMLKRAWIGKGLCLMYLGQFGEALTCYNEALILDPSQMLAWQGKGLSYENLGRYEEAIQCYEKCLILFPDNRTVLRLRNNLKERISAPDR